MDDYNREDLDRVSEVEGQGERRTTLVEEARLNRVENAAEARGEARAESNNALLIGIVVLLLLAALVLGYMMTRNQNASTVPDNAPIQNEINNVTKDVTDSTRDAVDQAADQAAQKAQEARDAASGVVNSGVNDTQKVDYNCDGDKTLEANFDTAGGDWVDLKIGSASMRLNRTTSSTATEDEKRYASSDSKTVFWVRGDVAELEQSGTTTYQNCQVK